MSSVVCVENLEGRGPLRLFNEFLERDLEVFQDTVAVGRSMGV
jgi:hypothetical protein